MTLNIWPLSPAPADLTREPTWNDQSYRYDSGVRQGSTPWVKPLYKYSFSLTNIPRSKQSSLNLFYSRQRGGVTPFLFQDPYDFPVNGKVCVNTGTNPTTFYAFDESSFYVIPKSGSLRITSNLSGALTQGSHYILNQDTGVITASMRPSSSDFWTASCEYYRKCFFTQYSEASNLWDNFSGNVSFEEMI